MNRPLSVYGSIALLLLAIAAARSSAAAEAVLELRPHEKVLDVALVDIDGDGSLDPVVSSSRATGPEAAERFISIYRIRKAAAAAELVVQRKVPDDVLAFSVGDLLGTGKRDLVYFTEQSVFALDAGGTPKPVVRGHRFVFSMPSRESLPFFDSIVDLNADGRDDLLLAEPSGYAVYLRPAQAGQMLVASGRIRIGSSYASEPLRRRRRALRDEGPLLTRRALRLVSHADVNADQRIDLIAMRYDSVLAYPQQSDGKFAEQPALEHRLVAPGSVPFAQTGAADPPSIAHADLNRDGRVDFVVPELDLRELSTRLRVFVANDAGLPERPTQIIKLSSLGSAPQLVDINGDGHPDLGCTTFRSDRLMSLSAGDIKTLDFSYYAFLFRPDKGMFSTSPDLRFDATWDVPKDERAADERESQQERGFIRFSGDFDGDGLRDAALFTADGEFSAHATRAAGEGRMSVSSETKPLFELKLPPTDNVKLADVDGNGRSDGVFVYDDVVRVALTP